MSEYPLVILPLSEDDGGGYSAHFPDLPGCMSDGETPQEAVENAMDALKCWMEVQHERGVEIPEPGASQVETDHQIEAMAKTIAKLTEDLEAARERIKELESTNGHWAVARKLTKHAAYSTRTDFPPKGAVA